MDGKIYAHSLEGRPTDEWEDLSDHLRCVAALASGNAERLGLAQLARVAGLLHDIGKVAREFQAYIRGEAPRGGDHATAGACQALMAYTNFGRALAVVIAGHHSGLADGDALDRRLKSPLPDWSSWAEHAGPLPAASSLRPSHPFPASKRGVHAAFTKAFMVRMLFSCLVDADFIATETFMNVGKLSRGSTVRIEDLADRLNIYVEKLRAAAEPTHLNTLRAQIFDHAMAKAANPPGFYTLTVPTGGGKTLASLAFALEHARAKNKRRVVVVIPFTSIIEQTAQVYRDALGDEAVLEHHASFDWEQVAPAHGDAGDERDGMGRLRRAAENWDAPVVVTTAVQFFESLFANRGSRCRKLHNLADSVIVLDEAQATPPKLLLPCLAALDELQRNYGATIVLCTATQPGWRQMDGALVFQDKLKTTDFGLCIGDDRELAPRSARLDMAFQRVRVEVMPVAVDDAEIASAFERAPQMLCIVNSRAHARDLFEAIRKLDGAVHLTTLMCAAHRREVLRRLKRHLREGLPVRLVATSLIEAGVDISFPEVWRASAGVDAVAQAAGRCNRHGEMLSGLGRVVVFTPKEAKVPAALRDFQQAARGVLRDFANPIGDDAVQQYFRMLYFNKGAEALDSVKVGDLAGILPSIQAHADGWRFPFESIARAFRMIDDAMRPVIIPFDNRARALLDELAFGHGSIGTALRGLQPYVVGTPERARATWLDKGILKPVRRDFGDTILQLEDLSPMYLFKTGLDLSDGAYRGVEHNLW